MKLIPTFAIIAVMATTFAQASNLANSLDEKSDLNRAKQYVTRSEAAITKGNGILDKSEQTNGQIIDSARESATKQLDQAKELLASAKEWFDKVPDSYGEKSAGLTLYTAAEEKLQSLEKRISGASEKIDKDNELLNQGSKNDAVTLDALVDQLAKLKALIGSDSITRKNVDQWPQLETDSKAMIAKYGNAKGSRGGNGDIDQRTFAIKIVGIKKDYESLLSEINGAYAKQEPNNIKSQLKILNDTVQKAVELKSYGHFLGTIPLLTTMLDAKGYAYESFLKSNASYDPSIVTDIQDAIKNVEETAKKLEAEIIQSNVPFKDIYTGADKASLKASIQANTLKKIKNAKILRIDIITSQWSRNISWDYNSYQTSWSKTDQSTMQAIVYVQGKDPNHIYMLGCPLYKDNLSGGEVTMIVPGSDEKPANPAFILLKAKFTN